MKPSRATAIHEAGHAVIARWQGLAMRQASILPDAREGSLGHVVSSRFSKQWVAQVEAGDLNLRGRDYAERRIRFSLAGGIAERRFLGRSNHVGSTTDREIATDLALAVAGGNDAEARLHLAYLAAQTEGLVEQHWWLIDGLADVLVRRTTLSGREVGAALSEMAERRFGSVTASTNGGRDGPV